MTPVIIDDRRGEAVYLNDAWEPVAPNRATLAKVMFEDGSVAFYKVSQGDVRAAAAKETALHRTADRLAPRLEVAIRLAFALGRRAIGRSRDAERAVKAIRTSLEDTLPKVLRKVYAAGGEVAAGTLRTAEWDESKHPRDEQGRFVYHGTAASNIDSIREKGLTPTENPLNFHHIEEASRYYAGDKGVMLRIRVSDLPARTTYDPLTSRSWTMTSVPSDKIEVETEKGKWIPLRKLRTAEFDPNQPRDEGGRWTDGEQEGAAVVHFNVPENFKLEDAEYDVNTRFPRDKMVVANVDLSLLPPSYPKDRRVSEMMDAIRQGAKFPPITIEQYPDKLNILDGWTRVAALRELSIAGKVPAVIRLYGDDSPLPEGVIVDAKRTANLRAGKDKKLRGAELRTAKRDDQRKRRVGPLAFTFDSASDEAIAWADRHAAELIDGITETSREAINNAIAEALEHGTDPYEEILEAVGDEARARLIAHHEVMTAVHEGQREAWRQATDEGLLSEGLKRTWIATPDGKLCAICEGLDGKTADLDGEYEGGIDGPPAHVACRCTEGLAG